MPNYAQLRVLITRQLKSENNQKKTINVTSHTLETALLLASQKLNSPISDLKYEILKSAPDNSTVSIAVQSVQSVTASTSDAPHAESQKEQQPTAPPIAHTTDSIAPAPYSLKVSHDRVTIKIDSDHPEFDKITIEDVHAAIMERVRIDADRIMLSDILMRKDDSYVNVANFTHNPKEDSHITLDVDDRQIHAWITITKPGIHGIDVTAKQLQFFLKNQYIIFGIDQQQLESIERTPRYNTRLHVVKGIAPQDGKDAKIVIPPLHDSSHKKKSISDNVDYKNIDNIKNVVQGTIIAKKIEATTGVDGKTIYGQMLPAKSGQDAAIKIGKNVKLTDDGKRAVAAVNGQLLIVDNIVTVLPTHTIKGDVGLKTGNIIFLGDVVVAGNVDDGFSVKASGKIEIYGYVGKSVIDSENTVRIHKGIAGGGEAFINCGKDCIAQYIENATVHASRSVTVQEEIIQSQIVAGEQVVCNGKRASIIGGSITSGALVQAKNIGSESGVITKIAVGLDPFRLIQLDLLVERQTEIKDQLRNLELMQGKKSNGTRAASLNDTILQSESIDREQHISQHELSELASQITSLREEISATQLPGKIYVFQDICQNVTMTINRIEQRMLTKQRGMCYLYENGAIQKKSIS